jgi:hypothetical protein
MTVIITMNIYTHHLYKHRYFCQVSPVPSWKSFPFSFLLLNLAKPSCSLEEQFLGSHGLMVTAVTYLCESVFSRETPIGYMHTLLMYIYMWMSIYYGIWLTELWRLNVSHSHNLTSAFWTARTAQGTIHSRTKPESQSCSRYNFQKIWRPQKGVYVCMHGGTCPSLSPTSESRTRSPSIWGQEKMDVPPETERTSFPSFCLFVLTESSTDQMVPAHEVGVRLLYYNYWFKC